VRKDRKKATKHDAAHRLASVLHVEGKDGVEAEYEKSEPFHDAWRLKSQDMLARAEFRRRKLVQRLQVRTQVDCSSGCCACVHEFY
jgi:DnaJ family protein C protein 8